MSKALIIVESPAKARTLKRYLGKDFEVKASVGHVRDLPVAKLGVDIENDFSPQYTTIKGKGKIITELKNAANTVDEIYLAPDPDREGEAIAWHIAHCLKAAKKPIHRALFHELTKKAILAAIANSTELNQNRFEAQQARRILDRLVGYKISPLLWKKVKRGLSAGRVQSVAVRMICEREQAVESFVPEEYWSINIGLEGSSPPPFIAQVDKVSGKKAEISNEMQAGEIVEALKKADFRVIDIKKKQQQRHPSPPFITSTLQQDANRKLRFTAKRTMSLAQMLYEGIELGDKGPSGLITYMRTDSTRINDEALAGVRDHIAQTIGKEYLPAKPILYKTAKSAQDAHEAIRPTDVSLSPEMLAPHLDADLLALYTLIWKRFIASQMKSAVYDQTIIEIEAGKYGLKATGSIIRFPGFMKLYQEAVSVEDKGKEAIQETDTSLPDLQRDEILQMKNIEPKQHFTQPPHRYSEATLIKALEENGVGRPSTYAATLSTIMEREYVELRQRRFYPTDLGKIVNELLVEHFPNIFDIDFTASMEADLDKVEEGTVNWLDLLRKFYNPFAETLIKAEEGMKSLKRLAVKTDIKCSSCGDLMVIKWGRKGEFLACNNFPTCKNTQNFTRGEDGDVQPVERETPEESTESCEKCGKPMVYKNGRFGKFLACSGYPQCKNIRAETTGVACPEQGCDGEITRKVSKRGRVFYGCNRFPKCKFALWDKPVSTPCPQCKAPFLLEKLTKSGNRLQCNNKECGYSKPMEEKE